MRSSVLSFGVIILSCSADAFLPPPPNHMSLGGEAQLTTRSSAYTTSRRVSAKQEEASATVPDMSRRELLNAIVLSAVGINIAALAVPYLQVLMPRFGVDSGDALAAKDILGNDVTVSSWLATHPPGDRSLVQGLKGDATYLLVNEDGSLADFGINAVCTHLACVVPWVPAENKFMCPCHGSHYDKDGNVLRGPAPLPLALAHVDFKGNGTVVLSKWNETDFRTGKAPWWT